MKEIGTTLTTCITTILFGCLLIMQCHLKPKYKYQTEKEFVDAEVKEHNSHVDTNATQIVKQPEPNKNKFLRDNGKWEQLTIDSAIFAAGRAYERDIWVKWYKAKLDSFEVIWMQQAPFDNCPGLVQSLNRKLNKIVYLLDPYKLPK